MSTVVTFNGASYIIPATGEVGWGNNVSSYLIAIAAGSLQKTGGAFTLSSPVDFGSSFGIKALSLTSETANSSATGIIRLANNSDAISWRNFANAGDLPLLVNASDQLTFNGTPIGGAGIFTPSRAIVSDVSGNLAASVTTLAELAFVSGVTSSIQTQLNGKEPTITVLPISKGGTNSGTTLLDNRIMQSSSGAIVEAAAITAARALISDANGIPTQSATTAAELAFVSGVTSAIQTQLNGKQATLSLPLSVANGGTGDSSLTAYAVLCGGTTSTNPVQSVASVGTSGFVLTSNGAGALPTFQAVSGSGTVNAGTTPQIAYYATTGNAVSGASNIEVIGAGQLRLTDSTGSSFSEVFLRNVGGGGLDIKANSVSTAGTVNGRPVANNQTIVADQNILVTSGAFTSDFISFGINNVEELLITGTEITANLPTTLTATAGNPIHGTNTNDSAAAGYVGQYIESVVSAVSLPSTGTYGDLTSISLTAGDWDVTYVALADRNGATWSRLDIAITPNSGNSSTGTVIGSNYLNQIWASSSSTPTQVGVSIPSYRVSLASTTTYYAKMSGVFSGATPALYGRLSARRVR